MALLKLVYYPDEILQTKAEPVREVTEKIAQFMDDMVETMYKSQGIGLAAPQVGLSRRILTMDVPESEGGVGLVQMANPEIIASSGTILWEEGCLSFPGISAQVKRAEQVTVQGLGRDGSPFELQLSGLGAVCMQHEVDHLDGINFVDHLRGLKRRLVLREYARVFKQMEAGGAGARA